MSVLLSLHGVVKRYRQGAVESYALRGVDLAVEAGDFLCLSGPSGSGKTTLLHLMGGLDRPSEGSVRLGSEALERLSNSALAALRLRRIGFVFQSYNLIPVLSAEENVALVMELRGMDAKTCRRRARAMLAEVGLAGLEGRRPAALSGGQQQRVAVARAIVGEPDLVLADEPTANLDSENGRRLLELMRRLNAQHGTTFVIATHDPQVMAFARRLVRLQDGRVVADERRHG